MSNYAIAIAQATTPGPTLTIFGPNLLAQTQFGVKEETSPSITALGSGKFYSVFHTSGHEEYWYYRNDQPGADWIYSYTQAGVSPAATYLPKTGSVAVALEVDGFLTVLEGTPPKPPVVFPLFPNLACINTSLAIATNPDGTTFVLAWGWESELWFMDEMNRAPSYRSMMAGTNPSVACWGTPADSSFMIAYQTGGGYLSAYGAVDGSAWKLPLNEHSSPSVAARPDGTWLIAYQDPFGKLWLLGPKGGPANTGILTAEGSSPAVAALASGDFIVAYRDGASGNLCTINPREQPWEPKDSGLQMHPGTSPAVVGLT